MTRKESGISMSTTTKSLFKSSPNHNGGGCWCIGLGQVNEAMSPEHEVSKTLSCMHEPMKVLIEEGDKMENTNTIVRRLTPLECERLQGFPDNWTDLGAWTDTQGKEHKSSSDASRYCAIGNSIALPFWQWLADRITAQYDEPPTMASLFDGIGGFPLVFSRAGCKPVWASEIEEFPIAVTKRHFGEE